MRTASKFDLVVSLLVVMALTGGVSFGLTSASLAPPEEAGPQPISPDTDRSGIGIAAPGLSPEEAVASGQVVAADRPQTEEEIRASGLIYIPDVVPTEEDLKACATTASSEESQNFICDVQAAIADGRIKPGEYTTEQWNQLLAGAGIKEPL